MVGTLWIARGTPNSGLPEAFESLRVNVLSSYTLLCGSEYFRTRVPVALSRCHYRRPIENGYLHLNVNHLGEHGAINVGRCAVCSSAALYTWRCSWLRSDVSGWGLSLVKTGQPVVLVEFCCYFSIYDPRPVD